MLVRFLTASLSLAFSLALLAQPTPAPRPCVGAYYFGGWTQEDTTHLTPRLTGEFGDREPLLGWRADKAEVIAKEIDYAAAAGLDFWAFDWYWPQGVSKDTPLHKAMKLYLASPNRGRLKFCLLVANHAGGTIPAADWERVTDAWLALFKEPTYLKVDGKPVIVLFSPREMAHAFGDRPDQVSAAFQRLRSKCSQAGLGGALVGCCATPGPENGLDDLDQLARSGYDFFTGYNYAAFPVRGGKLLYPYSDLRIYPFQTLIDGHAFVWDKFPMKTKVPFFPVVTVGWDKRPWESEAEGADHSVYYPDATPPQVTRFIRKGVDWLAAHPNRAINPQLLFIYAWNEIGEGGFILPTKSHGTAYLDAVAKGLKQP